MSKIETTLGVYCHDLVLGYGKKPVLKHVTGCFKKGLMTAIIGPNGCGKTTLFKALTGQIQPFSGRLDFKGLPPEAVAYLAQNKNLDPHFPLTVFDIVAQGLLPRLGFNVPLAPCHKDEVFSVIESLGLMHYADSNLGELSGGQQQRVLFARLSLQKVSLILLDEPFAAVDPYTVDELIDFLHAWQQQGATILMISHDLDIVKNHFQETLLLVGEPVAWGKTEDVLTPHNLRQAKTLSRPLAS